MTLTDLDQVLAIQQRCYPPHYREPFSAFENKLLRSPGTAWLAVDGGDAVGYLVTLLVDENHFPALHQADWTPPVQAKWLYLHDLAVVPRQRGGGAGHGLIDRARTHARSTGLQGLSLVAVQGSQPYWARQGFQVRDVAHAALRKKLCSFGEDACFMVRDDHRGSGFVIGD